MKQILCIICALVLSAPALFAQKTFTKAFSSGGKQKIIILFNQSSFEITGGSGNEISVTPDRDIPAPPERAKGLKPLYNKAVDNTGVGLDIQEAGGVMTIKMAGKRANTYKMQVPSGVDITVEDQDWFGGKVKIKDISGEIEIKSNQSGVELENITGPVVANTVNGNIEVKFTRLNPSKPSNISADNGFIDISLPADTKGNLELSTMNGEIYSDFDIKETESGDDRSKGLSGLSKGNISGTINGGGVEIGLSSLNGNIYIRKK